MVSPSPPARVMIARTTMARPLSLAAAALLIISMLAPRAGAQARPTPAQAQALLQTRPDLVAQLEAQLKASGLSNDQIRARLRAEGYPESLLDAYLPGGKGADSTAVPGDDVFGAMRALGLSDTTSLDSLRGVARGRRRERAALDSAFLDTLTKAVQNDSVRARLGIHDLWIEYLSKPDVAVRSRARRPGRRDLPVRPRRSAGAHSHRRRRGVVPARGHAPGIRRRAQRGRDSGRQPDHGPARRHALLAARPRVLGRAPRPRRTNALLREREPRRYQPGHRHRRRRPAERVRRVARRHGHGRALQSAGADRQRLAPRHPDSARTANRRRPRRLRLSHSRRRV